jgi:tetratricopeptide (TPR) repeat protein
MRRYSLAAAGAAGVVATLLITSSAGAITMVVGGVAGQCYSAARAGRFDREAQDLCTRALAGDVLDDHDRAGTHVNRGAMELRAKDYEAAHADFREALRIQPKMGEAHVGEGAYLITMERYAEAEPLLTRGIELGIEEPEKGYYFRGVARWGKEDFKGAYLDFTKASELKPAWILPREQLAHFKVEQH